MVASNDIVQRYEEIQLLIADDKIPEAVKRTMDFIRDFSDDKDNVNEVIVISASYTRLEKAERRGVLTFDQAEPQRNKLLYQMLALVDGVQAGLALTITT